jgi:hypothetical protein
MIRRLQLEDFLVSLVGLGVLAGAVSSRTIGSVRADVTTTRA